MADDLDLPAESRIALGHRLDLTAAVIASRGQP